MKSINDLVQEHQLCGFQLLSNRLVNVPPCSAGAKGEGIQQLQLDIFASYLLVSNSINFYAFIVH